MEAMELLKALERYCDNQCKYHGGCDKCKFANDQICNCQMQFNILMLNCSNPVEYIEQWAKENPAKTRQSKFLKLFSNAKLDHDGILEILPCLVDNFHVENCSVKYCKDCRRNYWLQEVE